MRETQTPRNDGILEGIVLVAAAVAWALVFILGLWSEWWHLWKHVCAVLAR
jgi:hypothetical protein